MDVLLVAMLQKRSMDMLIRDSERNSTSEGIYAKIVAIANLPTRHGRFQVVAFVNNEDGKEHTALVRGDFINGEDVAVRLHSECLTGDTLSSLRCDCRSQLTASLEKLGRMKTGILLYLRQEGRGIGFTNKIKAYALQDQGYDTYEANRKLGFKPDERHYDIAAHMLKALKVKSIRLMTNNPDKIRDLKRHGVKVTGRIPLRVVPNKYDKFYLKTKRAHMIEQEEGLSDLPKE